MKTYYKYSFEVTHNYGRFFLAVISWNKETALNMILESEGCPRRAVQYINKERAIL